MGSFNKFLKGLGKQEERTVDKIKVEKNPVLEELVEVYVGCIEEARNLGLDCVYQLCLECVESLEHCSKVSKH